MTSIARSSRASLSLSRETLLVAKNRTAGRKEGYVSFCRGRALQQRNEGFTPGGDQEVAAAEEEAGVRKRQRAQDDEDRL